MPNCGNLILLTVSLALLCQLTTTEAAAIICDDSTQPTATPSATAESRTATTTTSGGREVEPAPELSKSEESPTIDDVGKSRGTPKPATGNPITDTGATASTTEASEVKQFLRTVQCTLERAKPFVVEIEKTAKNIFSNIGEFVDDLLGRGGSAASIITSLISGGDVNTNATFDTVAIVATTTPANRATEPPSNTYSAASPSTQPLNTMDNEISDAPVDIQQICPDGFVADINRICVRSY